jgi:hypothetical protein
MHNNDLRTAMKSWVHEPLKLELRLRSCDLWNIYVIQILNYIINLLVYTI